MHVGLVSISVYMVHLNRREEAALYLVFCALSQLLAAHCIPGLHLQQGSEQHVGCDCQKFNFSVWVEAIQHWALWRKHLFYVLVVA